MALEKLMNRIRQELQELNDSMEAFKDSSVQPTVEECEKFQLAICRLQEHLAVYKFQKKEKEISPSFNIHAKVSEKELPAKTETNAAIYQEPIATKNIPETDNNKSAAPLLIGINDKFRFINELFKQNAAEYNIAIEQLSNLKSWQEAETYLHSLKGLYEWDMKAEAPTYFFSLIKRRYQSH